LDREGRYKGTRRGEGSENTKKKEGRGKRGKEKRETFRKSHTRTGLRNTGTNLTGVMMKKGVVPDKVVVG